jgi:tRNA pseudouridine13 synthase
MPKGSYATLFLESIAGKNYSAKDVKQDKSKKSR